MTPTLWSYTHVPLHGVIVCGRVIGLRHSRVAVQDSTGQVRWFQPIDCHPCTCDPKPIARVGETR